MTAKEMVDRIESRLKERRITKGEFFERCGVTAASMSNWRHNRNYPSMETMISIEEFLGADIFAKENPAPSGTGLPADFAAIYALLSPQGKADLDKYARFLLSQEGGK